MVGREAGGFGHAAGDGAAEVEFGFRDSLDDAFEGLETLVVEGEFAGEETAVGENVEVVGGGEARVDGVAAPAVGIEVEAEDEVGFEDGVDAAAAFSDFCGTVEETFAFAADGTVGDGGAVLLEAEASGFEEVWWSEGSERVVGGADEVDASAHGFEDGAEGSGGGEREVAFLDWGGVAHAVPAFFHAGPWAADVAWVDGDAEVCEGLGGIGEGREFRGFAPEAGVGFREGGTRGSGEAERVGWRGGVAGGAADEGGGVGDLDVGEPRAGGGGEGRVEELGEGVAGEGLLEGVEGGPIGRGREGSEEPGRRGGWRGGGFFAAGGESGGRGGGGAEE